MRAELNTGEHHAITQSPDCCDCVIAGASSWRARLAGLYYQEAITEFLKVSVTNFLVSGEW
jgi:hypothetical protein